MNLGQFLDENGEHRMRAAPRSLAATPPPVVVHQFDARTRQLIVIYEGPLELATVLELGRKSGLAMWDA